MRLGSLVYALFVGFMLHADIMYEMTLTTTTASTLLAGAVVNKRVFIKGDAARVEETITHPDVGEQIHIMIYRFDRGVVWTLDMDSMQYTETVFADTAAGIDDRDSSVTFFEKPEVSIDRTDARKDIVGKECEEVIVSLVEISDSMKTEQSITMWVTQELDSCEEFIMFHRQHDDMVGRLSENNGIVEQTSQVRLPEQARAIEGFPLELHDRLTISSEDVSMYMETRYVYTKLDDKPISQLVFEIPYGFTLQE